MCICAETTCICADMMLAKCLQFNLIEQWFGHTIIGYFAQKASAAWWRVCKSLSAISSDGADKEVVYCWRPVVQQSICFF